MSISKADQERLAQIRMESEKWLALQPESYEWDSSFLLRVIDELLREARKGSVV